MEARAAPDRSDRADRELRFAPYDVKSHRYLIYLFFNMMYPDVPQSVPYLLNEVRQGQRNLVNLMVVKP